MAVIPEPEKCGHCGNVDNVQTQGHSLLCYACGKQSNHDGTPIAGNHHARANISTTFPAANQHGMTDF